MVRVASLNSQLTIVWFQFRLERVCVIDIDKVTESTMIYIAVVDNRWVITCSVHSQRYRVSDITTGGTAVRFFCIICTNLTQRSAIDLPSGCDSSEMHRR